MTEQFQAGDALLIVDAQIDFFPEGALGVPEGDQIIPILNDLIKKAQKKNIPIIASRDWHPANHCSFKDQGGPWPPHCVQETEGAAFHPHVNIPGNAIIVNKAFEADHESYSAFQGKTLDNKSLAEELNELGAKRVWVAGLALDYCVKASVLEGSKAGFEMNVIIDATRAIDKTRQKEVIEEIKKAGGVIR